MSVKICKDEYTFENLYDNNDIVLSDFQKYSIKAIHDGHNSLVIAGTGSGKTMSVHYAIEHFIMNKCKRIIYTSPIKALSNQKYYEFTKKYNGILKSNNEPITFGIITGDIKCNPDADCVIMTCEILRNALQKTNNIVVNIDGICCVIFDEIHYINDPDRGTVWEETIMLIGSKNKQEENIIQLVMLSATIEGPEKFAQWVSNKTGPETWVSGFQKRVVPLVHYSFLVVSNRVTKTDSFKKLESGINLFNESKNNSDCSRVAKVLIQDSSGSFNSLNYEKVRKVINYNELNRIETSKEFVINETLLHLQENNMLPALYFSLSKTGVVSCAESVSLNLNADIANDSLIENECRKIISRLPNYHDFIELPEYKKMVSLISKGIAYHHSGLLGILREMVELLFEKGFIKILFATETFSVGLNMPTKTVIFDSFTKYDGNNFRFLRSHEYVQMAGRAGRRGIDTIGYAIHLNNLFREFPSSGEYKEIMNGSPLRLHSKFKIDKSHVLEYYKEAEQREAESKEADNYMFNNSLLKVELDKDIAMIRSEIEILEKELEGTIDNSHDEFVVSVKLSQKQRKANSTRPRNAITDYENEMTKKREKLGLLKKELDHANNYYSGLFHEIEEMLLKHEFITQNESVKKLSKKGHIALSIKDDNALAITDVLLYIEEHISDYSSEEIAAIMCSLLVSHDSEKDTDDLATAQKLVPLNNILKNYQIDNLYNFKDYYSLVLEWTMCTDKESCIETLNKLSDTEKGTFLKDILRLSGLVQELLGLGDYVSVELLHKINQVPDKILKYIVTNQSLYI